jgi:biopolymer transport protein ExbD
MKFPRNAKVFRGQLDAAPISGVFFLLVLFMLLNSNLVFTPGVRINLPRVEGPPLAGVTGPVVLVALDISGNLYFENQIILTNQLSHELQSVAKATPEITLIVQADREVKLDAFFHLSKLASEAGIRQTLLASRPDPTSGMPSPISKP